MSQTPKEQQRGYNSPRAKDFSSQNIPGELRMAQRSAEAAVADLAEPLPWRPFSSSPSFIATVKLILPG
jgi:hypothetical protein